MSQGALLLISDIHTQYGVINAQIRHAQNSGTEVREVLVLGDFGFFGDEMHAYFRRGGHRFLKPVASLDGNHEDHGALPDLAKDYADVVTYLPRGTLHPLGQWGGLCLGGARYMDAGATPRGCEITEADLTACLTHDQQDVDAVFTHDCPDGIGVPNSPGLEHYGPPGVPGMAALAAHFHPRWWVFGHHHKWFDVTRDDTRYLGLPQSWTGYALLQADGRLDPVHHEVSLARRPWWKEWFHLR